MSLSRVILTTCLLLIASLLGILFFSAFTGKLKHPENLLRGEWKEVSWTYDKVDGQQQSAQQLSDEVRDDISRGMFIHASETWIFTDESTLLLRKKHAADQHIKWRLKGRGHILKLHYPNQQTEYYQIRKLNANTLELHFETDTHARGIVKILLQKTLH